MRPEKSANSRHLFLGMIVSFALTFVWMVVIFWLSAQVAEESNELSTGLTAKIADVIEQIAPEVDIDQTDLNHLVRKNGHFFSYLLLGLLAANSLRLSRRYAAGIVHQGEIDIKPTWAGRLASHLTALSPWRLWFYVWIFCLLYALSDELHQVFVPGRGCQIQDVLVDSAGAAVGILLCLLVCRLASRKKKRQPDELFARQV